MHLSRSHGDRWGATDIATLFLHLILFAASLRALQNLNPSFVGPCFSLLALLLVQFSWQALLILIYAQTTLTCVSLLWLRYHRRGPMAFLVLFLTASLMMWSLYGMPSSFPKHLISVACSFFRDRHGSVIDEGWCRFVTIPNSFSCRL